MSEYPSLKNHVGKHLIVTDGTTLLGADDKAGIAEIVSAIVYLQQHPEIKHGKIRVGFNPDEEIGLGAHKFDVEKFGCQWAYTMDGSEVGELEFENFNAAAAKIIVKGRNVHPGYAKNKMVNAIRVANEFMNLIPGNETPETTEGYEGFYHLVGLQGEVEQTTISYIIRDHDRTRFEERKQFMLSLVEKVNAHYGEPLVSLDMKDQYYNMREKIEPVMYVIDIAMYPSGLRKSKAKGQRQTTFRGYSEIPEFYAPEYPDGPIQGDVDYRRTLYWNPALTTDAQGETIVTFYNNSYSKRFDVSCEGITPQGTILHAQ